MTCGERVLSFSIDVMIKIARQAQKSPIQNSPRNQQLASIHTLISPGCNKTMLLMLDEIIDCTQYSKLDKLFGVTAHIFRFVNILRCVVITVEIRAPPIKVSNLPWKK